MFGLKKYPFFQCLVLLLASCQMGPSIENYSSVYEVTQDRVTQGSFTARALSPHEIISDYVSFGNQNHSPAITFKFAINGKDNEMISGSDHQFKCLSSTGICETPLIRFGERFIDDRVGEQYLPVETEWLVRLDMRHVHQAFKEKGFYETSDGRKLYQKDFEGVFIAGGTAPLTWDFNELKNRKDLQLEDEDGDGIYEIRLTLNKRNGEKKSWKLSKDISNYPQYTSDQLLVDALYNMSLEELILNIEEDGTFRTGAEWDGVWTRDISYSAILSLALLHPEISKTSLRKKVRNGRIIQDTGTGGAYPVSTDRVVWAIAAWEIYVVTGEQAWLEEIYPIIKNTLSDDIYNAYNSQSGLVKGESSFLDWREQSYPEWMEPADIYESETLGTSAVHFKAHELLAEMASQLGNYEDRDKYSNYAQAIKTGINENLWLEDKGYYSQYLYGRNFKIASPRAEALGAALTVLFNIADKERQKTVVANTPVIDFGIPSIFPQIPNIPPYHNDGIWPFVQAYWSLANAKTGNDIGLTQSLDALYRAAALFVTNKENFVADSGDYEGTQINSDRQLWSVAGNLGMVYKVFFGMDFHPDKLVFNPMVPEKYKGNKKISNFKYRNALLELELEGYGNRIQSVTMDGKILQNAEIPADLEGSHHLKIILTSTNSSNQSVNLVDNAFSPAAPKVSYLEGNLTWEKNPDVKEYLVLRNGEVFKQTTDTSIALNEEAYGEYQVIAINAQGLESFATEPLPIFAWKPQKIDFSKFFSDPQTKFSGYTGKGYITTNVKENTQVNFELTVEASGIYALTVVYSNGHGPVNTDNKSALRSIKSNDQHVGTFVFPQRGSGNWEEWGISNPVQLPLEAGNHYFSLSLEDHNHNMNVDINEALLDQIRLIRIQ